MFNSYGNIVSFGSLDRFLEELEINTKKDGISESVHRAVRTRSDRDAARCREEISEMCQQLDMKSILLLRCLVRSITDRIPLGSIASGLVFFSDKSKDEKLKTSLIKDWVLATSPSDLSIALPVLVSTGVKNVLDSSGNSDDLFCFWRFELALVTALFMRRNLSTSDACYALISTIEESEKISMISKISPLDSWEDLRMTGFPLWIVSPEQLKRQSSSLLRKYSFELREVSNSDQKQVRKLTELTLFWAAATGLSPKSVAAWKWKENQKIFTLLSSDWSLPETRESAFRAVVAYRKKSEYLFAAAVLIWLGDIHGACRDCFLRGLGDWQLALFIADLLPGESQLEIYLELWDNLVLAPKDPWLGVAICIRMQSRGLAPPALCKAMLSSWMDGSVFDSAANGVAVTPSAIESSKVSPALQELDLVLNKLSSVQQFQS